MKKILVLLGFMLLSLQAQAQVAAIDLVKGEGDVLGLRLGYRPVEWHLAELPVLGDAQLYMEVSANLWRYGKEAEYESNLAVALSPVLVKQFSTLYDRALYWEFGIGFSLLNKQRFAGKDLGSHFQFEDRLGFGLGRQQVAAPTFKGGLVAGMQVQVGDQVHRAPAWRHNSVGCRHGARRGGDQSATAFSITTSFSGTSSWKPLRPVGRPSIFLTISAPETTLPNTA